MEVKIKKLHNDAIIPTYAKDGDSGLDITAISEGIRHSETGFKGRTLYEYYEYSTGLSIEIPIGYVGLIFPRSSISKTSLILTNSVGVIDSGYRGEIKFRFKVVDNLGIIYDKGDKIGQLIILPFPEIIFKEVEELSITERGEGGFGSTGK